ncbi:MAG: hypothetical protein A2X11_01430 [Bacteroidetes bacterium GWE2_42_24]|nr:MAG: hypothetical protein A2X11_01430 [Bacteroidetes bacterium GWE2_42_24]OFY27354.1 MAG: hypothetical protein A2X09_00635 [Bacteroidetes bacterium GWF2_43_11]
MLLLMLGGVQAQIQTLTISGIVTHALSGAPIVNHDVVIQTDSSAGNFFYFNTVSTNSNGAYIDTIPVTSGSQGQGLLVVSTVECNGTAQVQQLTFGPGNMTLTSDFVICSDTIPFGCQSSFYYYADSTSNATVFVDASQGSPNSWIWNFGDGTTSTEQNPVHVYAQPGEYIVTLVIATAGGCSSSSTQLVNVSQPSGCQASYRYYPIDSLNMLLSNTIQFVDQSYGSPELWFWNFGDGTTSYEQNPVHEFAQFGEYMVCLTIYNLDSTCYDNICLPVWVGNPAGGCQATFTFFPADTLNLLVSNTLQFMDQSSGNPIFWHWDFGDGTTSTEQNPLHIFPNEGSYQVCLSITGADSNCFSDYCRQVWVGNTAPGCRAMFYYYPADSLNQSNNIQFADQSLGNSTEWLWNFGDGITSTGQNPLHLYQQPGIYHVCLAISNPTAQCYDTVCHEVSVNAILDSCENVFSASVSGLTATFDGSMVSGDTASFTWEFGDGYTATGNQVAHTYIIGGLYTVTLTTVSTRGCVFSSASMIFLGDTALVQTIQGTIRAGSLPVSGVVLLMPQGGIWNWGAQTTAIDSMGVYRFEGVMPGSYHLLAVPYSVAGDTMAYLPTYYGNVIFWEQASAITLGAAALAYDIDLVACNGIIPGDALINGNIMANGLKAGMYDVNIMLLDQQNNPLVFDRSDAAGSFDFNALAYGTYTIWAELHGVSTLPVTLTLSAEKPFATVNLKLDGTSVMGIGTAGILESTFGQVYPNPVEDLAKIEVTTLLPVPFELSLINTMGQVVMNKYVVVNGNSLLEVETTGLPTGVYTLLLRGNDGSRLLRKFVKANR